MQPNGTKRHFQSLHATKGPFVACKSLAFNNSYYGAVFARSAAMCGFSPQALISGCVARRDPNNTHLRRPCAAFRAHRRHKGQHLSARGIMAVAGGSTHGPVIRGVPGVPVFHRVKSPTQTRTIAAQQVSSMEIWGAPARGSSIPSVKAYRTALPDGRRGVEFCSTIAPAVGSGSPYEARWYLGSTPGVIPKSGSSYAAIPVSYIKNTQVP